MTIEKRLEKLTKAFELFVFNCTDSIGLPKAPTQKQHEKAQKALTDEYLNIAVEDLKKKTKSNTA